MTPSEYIEFSKANLARLEREMDEEYSRLRATDPPFIVLLRSWLFIRRAKIDARNLIKRHISVIEGLIL